MDHDFEDWLIAMDDKLAHLMSEVPLKVSVSLDYSAESLSILEQWLVASFPTKDFLIEIKGGYFLDRLSCYVGETFRKHIGGSWSVDYSNENSVFFGLPVLIRSGKAPRCPLIMVSSCLDRKTGNFLVGILTNLISAT